MLPAVLAEAQRLHYDGPIPVAGYCAAPTPAPGAWVGWSLCSAIPGLGTVAKGLALEAYRAKTLAGVAQFYDRALRVHRKFGPMEMRRRGARSAPGQAHDGLPHPGVRLGRRAATTAAPPGR